jgi:hypothetical protein
VKEEGGGGVSSNINKVDHMLVLHGGGLTSYTGCRIEDRNIN